MGEIEQELRACAQMVRGANSPSNILYSSNYDLVVTMGRPFDQRLNHDCVRRKKLCFQNCFDLVRDLDGYYYCEGYARPPDNWGMLFDHAWLVNAEGQVLDPTWHDARYVGSTYFGIPFEIEYVIKRALKTEVYGVLNHLDLLRHGLPPGAVATLFADCEI